MQADMHSKCASLEGACKVADKSHKQIIVSGNTFIAGYAQCQKLKGAPRCDEKMQQQIIDSNAVKFVSMLKTCHIIAQGRVIHTLVMDRAVESDPSIGIALVAMYARCSSMEDAHNVFGRLPTQDARSLAAILSGYTNQGHGEKALRLFEKQYIEPDVVIFICILKACSSIGGLVQGKLTHAGILEKGFDLDQIVGNTLVDMYAKCSSLSDAYHVFISMPRQDVVSWCTLILGNIDHGHNEKALQLFEEMQQVGIEPNRVTFLCILRACASLAALEQGRSIHVNLTKHGLGSDLFVGSTLIDMYAKCQCLEDARNVFDNLHVRNVVSWSAMISGYFEHEQSQEALSLFKKMKEMGIEPDKGTYVCILKVCAHTASLDQGKLVHIDVVKKGLDSDSLIGSSLVDMYIKFGSIKDAGKIFDIIPVQDMVAWSSMIAGHVERGHGEKAFMLFEKMVKEGIKPDAVTFVAFLKACSHVVGLDQGKLVHFEIIKRGLESNIFVCSILVDMYAKCGCINDARCVFDSTPTRNVVLWNAMIARYTDSGFSEEAFKLFKEMQEEDIHANRVTALCILKACSSLGTLGQGRLIHVGIMTHGLQSEPFVGNALIDMYAQCGSVDDAHKVFDDLLVRDVVSWSAIISAHAEYRDAQDALKLFKIMQQEGVEPNEITFVCILYACSNLTDIDQTTLIHHHIIHWGLESNLHIGSTLIDVYAKCGSIDEACRVFDMMPARNVVAWSMMISMYAKYGYDREVFDLFEEMQMEGTEPNEVTYMHALDAFSSMGALDHGRLIHLESSKRGFDLDLFVGNTLVGMYARCGSLDDASKVFDKLPNLTLVSWNAMISGLADHGQNDIAQHYLDKMQEEGIRADGVTLVSLLSSCSHEGLVQEGYGLLKEMENYGVKPSVEHYVCMVDMLGRAGLLCEAEESISRMPMQPNWLIWMTLLGSCAKYYDMETGRQAFDHLVKSNCRKDAMYVLMSNIYSANCMWQAAKEVREMGTEMEAWKH